MTQYQVSQLQLAAILLLVGVIPSACLILVRRKIVSPVVGFGVIVGVLDVIAFVLGYLGSEGAVLPVTQVLINYLKDAPTGLVITYVCLLQARRYRAARNGDGLRKWFNRAPFVIGATFFGGLGVDLVVRPPVLESAKGVPAVAFVAESARYVAFAAYAALTSFVFFKAARDRMGPLGAKQRYQNLFMAVAMAGVTALPLHTLVWRGVRAFATEEQVALLVERLSFQEVLLVGFIEVNLALAIVLYSARSRRSRFMERFWSFLDLAGDLTEELANAPISKYGLNLPYACLREAAGPEFLNLSSTDKRKMDNAFRTRVVLEQRADDDEKSAGRITRDRLLHLSRLYEDELENPVLAKGFGREASRKGLPDTLQELLSPKPDEERATVAGGGGLRETLSLVLETFDDGAADLTSSPEWQQLVYVASADAGLLSAEQREAISNNRSVSQRVLDGYRLVQYKVHNYGDDPAPRWP